MIPNIYQWDIVDSHRCEGSVQRGVSILRFKRAYVRDAKHEWQLVKHNKDLDYGVIYHHPAAIIDYCPFCGRKLEVFT